MIKKFAVTNYRGFKKQLVWDLTGFNYDYNEQSLYKGIVQHALIIGKNGSGKSNLGLALFDIVNHLSDKHTKSDYYSNFIYAGDVQGQVDFEYEFVFDEDELRYSYSKDTKGTLVSEELLCNGNLVFSWNQHQIEISSEFQYDEMRINQIFQRDNAASVAKILYASNPLESNHYLIRLKEYVDRMLWFRSLEDRDFIGFDLMGSNIHEYIIRENLINEFTEFLKNVSGQVYDFSPTQSEDDRLWCLIGGSRIEFSRIQSTGTSSLTLLFFWIQRIAYASFVFIDEFDAFYHFELGQNIVRNLFKTQGVQIVLSTHSTSLISNEMLRPDCYYIISDNHIKALNKLTQKELREYHNIEKMYRGKTFGL